MATDVSDALRRQIADRAYHVCEYCLIHEDDTFWGCQIDHIISRKHGGNSEAFNLAWACALCNNAKGSDLGTLAGPLTELELTRLYHPRFEPSLSVKRGVPLNFQLPLPPMRETACLADAWIPGANEMSCSSSNAIIEGGSIPPAYRAT